jgi:hypothetical protein
VTVLDPNGDKKLVASAPQTRDGADSPPMTGKPPFARPGPMKFQVGASGPWHTRVIEFNAPK